MSEVTKLKRAVVMRAGGTPAVDDPSLWDENGLPWVAIGDMTRPGPVVVTDRGVTPEGIASKSLPVGGPGTLLFAMYASVGAVNILGREASWNQAILGMEPRPGLADARFTRYWLEHLKPDLYRLTRSNTQHNLNADQVGNLPFSLVGISVQRKVADYLDQETARIDGLVNAKRRMIALFKERRLALRDHAFDAKPGKRLKRLLAKSMAYGVLVPDFVEAGTGVPMIRTYNLAASGRVDHDDIAEIPVRLAMEYRRTSLHSGDLILSVVGSMGRSAVVEELEAGFNLNRPLARLRFRPEVPPRLIWHWTQTTHFMDMAKLVTSGGTAQPTLNLGDLANFAVGLPAESAAWPGMLAKLDDACAQLDDAERVLVRQIELLLERRQALITAAVTGELDLSDTA